MSAAGSSRSPAGFWKRYLAYSIDMTVISVLVWIIARLTSSPANPVDLEALLRSQTAGRGAATLLDPPQLLTQTMALLVQALEVPVIATALIAAVYFIGTECSTWQATPGKRLVGIKVIDRRGVRIGRARAAARFAAGSLSWLTLNLGHALAAWPPEKRALHDYLAGTYVDNVDPAQPGMPAWGWLVIGAQGLLLLLLLIGGVVLLVSVLATLGGV